MRSKGGHKKLHLNLKSSSMSKLFLTQPPCPIRVRGNVFKNTPFKKRAGVQYTHAQTFFGAQVQIFAIIVWWNINCTLFCISNTFCYFYKLQVCSGRGFSKSQQQDRLIEMHGSLRACRGADAIVFNLFACEGWFIAKYFDVPCVAASPFAVTR